MALGEDEERLAAAILKSPTFKRAALRSKLFRKLCDRYPKYLSVEEIWHDVLGNQAQLNNHADSKIKGTVDGNTVYQKCLDLRDALVEYSGAK